MMLKNCKSSLGDFLCNCTYITDLSSVLCHWYTLVYYLDTRFSVALPLESLIVVMEAV